jgi:hypothetical protein
MIGQNRQTEIGIAQSPTTLTHDAKFSRLVQALAGLEALAVILTMIQGTTLGAEPLAALGASPAQQATAALGGHAGAKTMGAGAMQIAGIECAFHGSSTGLNIRASIRENNDLRGSREAARVLTGPGCVNRRPGNLELDSLPLSFTLSTA